MMSATAEGGGTGAVNSSEVTGRPAQALPTFLQDVDRAQTDEMIRLLAQATAHYGGATAEAIDDVASKFNITTEQVDEVIRWIETAEPERRPVLNARRKGSLGGTLALAPPGHEHHGGPQAQMVPPAPQTAAAEEADEPELEPVALEGEGEGGEVAMGRKTAATVTSGHQATPAQSGGAATVGQGSAATEEAHVAGDGLRLEPLQDGEVAFARSRVRSVEISDHCTSKRGKTSYTLRCTSGSGSTWEVTKRYREFHALHESLIKKHAPIGSIQFPPKSFWKGSNEETVEARKHGLCQWINSIVCMEGAGRESVEREVQMFLVQTEGRNDSLRNSVGEIVQVTAQSSSPSSTGVIPEYSGRIFLEEKEPGSLFGGESRFNCYLFQLQTGRAEVDGPRCMLARPLEPGKPPIDVRGAQVTKRPRNELQDFCVQIRDQKGRNFVLGWPTSDEENAKHWEWLEWLQDAGATLSKELLTAMHEADREKAARQSHSQPENCWVHAAIERAKVGDWAGLLGCMLHRPAHDNHVCLPRHSSCEVTRMSKELLNYRPAFYNSKGGQRWGTILHQIVYPKSSTYRVCRPAHMAFRRLIAEGCEFDLAIQSGERSRDPRERQITVLQLIDYKEKRGHTPLDRELVQLVRKLADLGRLDESDLDKPAFDCEVEWQQGACAQRQNAHRGRLRLHVVYQRQWQLEFEGDEPSSMHRHWDLPQGAVDWQICDDEQVLRVRLWDSKTEEPELIWLQFAFVQGSADETMEELHLASEWLCEHRNWALAVEKQMWTGVVSSQPLVCLVWEACCSPEGGRTQDMREKIWRKIGGGPGPSIGTVQGRHSIGKIRWMEEDVTAWSNFCTPFEVVKALSSGGQHATSVVLTLSGVDFRHRMDLPGALQRHPSGAEKRFRSRQEAVIWIQKYLILDSDSLQQHLERSFQADTEILQFERVKDDGTFSKYEINLHTMVQTNIDGTKAALWRWQKIDQRGHRTWENFGPECAQRLEEAYTNEISQVDVGDGHYCVSMANKQRMWQVATGSLPEQVKAPVIRSEQIVPGSERMIRRTADHRCPQKFASEQSNGVEQHKMSNSTGFALHLVEYKLSEGRWYVPPPGRVDVDEEVRWSTCNGAEGFIVYDLYGHGIDPVATLTLKLEGDGKSADATDINAKFSTKSPPISAALVGVMSRTSGRCQREFCETCCSDCVSARLPQLESCRNNRIQLLWNYSKGNEIACRWRLIETRCYTKSRSSRNTTKTMCSITRASGPARSVGKGSTFVTCCWTAETEVQHELRTDYYEQKVLCKRNASIHCAAQDMIMALGVHAERLQPASAPVLKQGDNVAPILKQGDKVVVLEDEHGGDFVRVLCPSTARQGYVPACLLADDRASHTWEVEIRSSHSDDPVIIPALEVKEDEQVRGASMFDLDCDRTRQPSIKAEVRKTPSERCRWEGEWQLIVCGLSDDMDYQLRMRSTFLTDTSAESKNLSAQVQVNGKGDFVPVQLALNDTVLSLGTSRRACIVGCETRSPKSERKGHPYAFRVDLNRPDSFGDKKYIIDPGSEAAQQTWIRALKYPTGEWSKTVAIRTCRDAPTRPLNLKSNGECFKVGGLVKRVGTKLGKAIEPFDSKRWVRIRPDATCGDKGMDVVWNLQPKSDVTQQTLTLLDNLTVKVLVEAIEQDTSARPTLPNTVHGRALCGRVKVDPRQMLRLEFQTGQTEPIEIYGSWLTSHNSDIVEQRDSLPTGRFLRVERCDGRPLEIAQVCVKDSTGRLVTGVKAAMSSSGVHSGQPRSPISNAYVVSDMHTCGAEETFPARYAVDGNLGTYCKTLGGGEQWLRIDMGKLLEVQEIELVLGFEIDGLDHDGGGITLSITSDASGDDCAWEGKPIVRRSSSDWMSRHRFETVSQEPEPETAETSSLDGGELQRQLSSRSLSLKATSLDVQPFLEYDSEAFHALCEIKERLISTDPDVINPTPWKDIADSRIPMPFDPSVQAVGFRVVKKFGSKAAPFEVHFKDAQDSIVCAVMKEGDDLRADQLVMHTLKFFNSLWDVHSVRHVTAAGVSVTVAAPTYRIAPCGHHAGFLELLPHATTVENIEVADSACNNDFPSHDNLLPSAVAAFISGFALKVKDRHKSNMLVLDDGRFANIDFGWLGEAATYNVLGIRIAIDADDFPIPEGLKYRLKHDHLWEEFCDLCWDAMRVLDRHIDDIDEEWKRLLCESKMTNSYLVKEMPKNIRKRLRAHKRAQLDEELVAGKSISAKIKDYAHTKGQESHVRNKAKAPGSPVLPPTSLSDPEGLAAGTLNLKSRREQQQEKTLEAAHSESAPTAHPQPGTVGGAAAATNESIEALQKRQELFESQIERWERQMSKEGYSEEKKRRLQDRIDKAVAAVDKLDDQISQYMSA